MILNELKKYSIGDKHMKKISIPFFIHFFAKSRHFFFGLLTVALTMISMGPTLAGQFCTHEIVGCDLVRDDNCLEKTYACGKYQTLIHTLYAEDYAPTTVQKYFLGASLYGLYIRNRAKSLQCEYMKAAKENLEDFLLEKELQFTSKGTFGTANHMNQTYHATKMINDLKGVSGCLESAYTRSKIERLSKAITMKNAKSVFLAPNDQMKDHLDSIILGLRGFISKASDLETGIVMRRIEIKTGERHLNNIKEIFKEIFGEVQVAGQDVIVKTDILSELERKSGGYLKEVKLQELEFKQALGGISPEEYSNIRFLNIKEAMDFMKKSAFHINILGEVINADPSKPFGKVWVALNSSDGGQEVKDSLAEIKRSWKSYGVESGICERAGTGAARTKKWFCN